MDVCVGVYILCNYASSSDSNDTPAGTVCLVTSVLLTTVLLKQSSTVSNSFCRKHFWSTNGAGSMVRDRNCVYYDHVQPPTSVPVFPVQQRKQLPLF